MKNISVYSDCSHTFFEKIVNSKRAKKDDKTYKERLNLLCPNIKSQFKDYDDNFGLNSLVSIKSSPYLEQNKIDLLSLYKYGSKSLQQLKIRLTTDSKNRVHNICQNCTISEVNSFDHYIPKGDYPEFSVHPKNLMPSCTKCNSKKSTTWKVNNKVVFLNLYLDTLPSLQYLFVDFRINGDDIEFEYFIDNRNNINKDLFELIKTHYEKLDLLQRFKENSDLVISEIDNEFKAYSSLLGINDIAKTIIEKREDDKKIYGFNYWKSILTISLLSNLYYLKSAETKYFK
jgi:5-methylcytosine-specific restriction endonuclease McrA